ncbi:MAG: MFS transporter [Chitinophagales bacterium]|nr:MFS transporter [Chitinophagales bacterium]
MNLLEHKRGRAFLVFSLYLSEGAPIGFIWWALPTILRGMDIDIEKITSITALLVLPWIFKFIWAPLVDGLRSKRFGFKAWILVAQTIMGLSLLPLLYFSPVTHLNYWIICLIIHSLAAATQDVAIDAMVINTVATNERGMLNGYMQAGMLTGRSVFGGGALMMVPAIGLQNMLLLLIGSIVITMLLLTWVIEPPTTSEKGPALKDVFKDLASGFKEKNTWRVILFALTSAAAFEVTGGLAGPFLTDIGVSEKDVGFLFFIPVVVSMLLGGLAGGWLSDHRRRKRSVSFFLVGFVLFVIITAVMKLMGIEAAIPYYVSLAAMYFFVGMFTSSSYALFMDQTNPKIGATQFSTYMAATNGCESWTVWAAGRITGAGGYAIAFLAMSLISLLSLFILKNVRGK